MKIQKPFTSKRILAIVLGIILFGFDAYMIYAPGIDKDTAGEMFMMVVFMGAMGLSLILYGVFGGKEPEIGIIKKNNKTK